MKYITRILIALVVLALLASCGAAPEQPLSAPDDLASPYTVTTLDGDDITARVEELWTFANDLYAPPLQGGGDTLYDTYTGYPAYKSIDDRFDTRRDYFTTDCMEQLDRARTGRGRPVFYTRDATTYRRPDMMSEMIPGDITDITTLSTTSDRIILSIEYTDPMWGRTDRLEVLESDHRYVNFTVALSEGVWKIADYEYPDMTDGIYYASAADHTLTETDVVPYPSREDTLDPAVTVDDYRAALRRVYLLNHLDEIGLSREQIDLDSLELTHLGFYFLRDTAGTTYIIEYCGSYYSDDGSEPLFVITAKSDGHGGWLPADEANIVDDETAAEAKSLVINRPPRFARTDGAPPSNMTVIRRNIANEYLIFAETSVDTKEDKVDLIYSVELLGIGFGIAPPLAKLDGTNWEQIAVNFSTFPSRTDLLRPCHDSALLREMRRAYFEENCWDFGIGSANILADTIAWEGDATFTFTTGQGERYSVTFYDAARAAELPSSHEIFTVTELTA